MDLRINNFIVDDIEKYMIYDINIINQNEYNNINKEKFNKMFQSDNKKSDKMFESNKEKLDKQINNTNLDNKQINNTNLDNKYSKFDYQNSKLFIPKHNDKLFWCLYILENGINIYNLNFNSAFSIEKEFKIKAITFMKNNEHNVKIKKTQVESNLLFDKRISIQSLSLLCNMYKINVRLINNNFYYEFLNNDTQEFKNIIIENKKFGIDFDNKYQNIENKLLITNISKPINSLSYYKVDELVELATKLKINVKNENNKNKTKKDIYDEVYKVIYDC